MVRPSFAFIHDDVALARDVTQGIASAEDVVDGAAGDGERHVAVDVGTGLGLILAVTAAERPVDVAAVDGDVGAADRSRVAAP